MTDTQSALLRAVLADPASDDARLVYADWLQDDGDQPDRAEFIRVQVEMATIPDPPPEPSVGMRSASRSHRLAALRVWSMQWKSKYYTLRARERELLTSYGDIWADAVFPAEYKRNGGRAVFSRGFISQVTCTDWLQHHAGVFWHPDQTVQPRGRTEACDTHDYSYPRPCPAMAQPIERVVLTTEPDWEHWNPVFSQTEQAFYDDRWPGIVFEVRPLRVNDDGWGLSEEAGRRIAQQIEEEILRGTR